ncbi:hypothetical protein [Alicyclobacillus sendaiensis]|nr:hypothetical protein [Alicyclobacillus sendaiensis]
MDEFIKVLTAIALLVQIANGVLDVKSKLRSPPRTRRGRRRKHRK